MRALLLPPLFLAALAAAASAQIVVQTGDDLEAIVNAAPSGSVIEIQSDATFAVTLKFGYTWTKDLTLQAGVGFAPVLQGTTTAPIKIQCGDMKLRFDGLTINAASPGGNAVKIVKSVFPKLQVFFDDCLVDGDIYVEPGPSADPALSLESTEVTGWVHLDGLSQGDLIFVMKNSKGKIKEFSPSFAVSIQALIEDSVLTARLVERARSAGSIWQIRRTRIDGGVELWAKTFLPQHEILLESCLLVGSGTDIGIQADDYPGPKLTAINCTVTNFQTGARLLLPALVTNSLLDGNSTQDMSLAPGTPSSVVQNSLIGFWTGGYQNGNFTGQVLFDTDWSLMAGSAGIDAGVNATPDLGPLDFYGNPRIQDNDGDGTAKVDVGAIESVSPLKALISNYNGSGVNPADFTGTPPILGTVFHGAVAKLPTTMLTIMAIDSPSLVPFAVPGWTGEVLVAASPLLLLDFGFGDHSVPIPADPALIGGLISAQGARLDLNGAVLETVLLNRLDLVLGI